MSLKNNVWHLEVYKANVAKLCGKFTATRLALCKSVQQCNSKLDIMLRLKRKKNLCPLWTYKQGFYKNLFTAETK